MARLLCLGLGLASAFVAPGGDRAPLTRVREFGQGEPGISPNDPGVLAPLVTDRQRTIKLADMPGALPPVGVFDPFDLAGELTDSSLRWYRAAELKHGRVCMLAFTGWWVTEAFNFHLKGFISVEEKVSFDDIANVDWFADSWAKVPASGQAQILTVIGLLEWYTECNGVHYTKGGAMPNYPPFNNAKQLMALEMKPEKLVAQQTKELNNGRLAMIGVASLFAQHYIPGSVPLLKGII